MNKCISEVKTEMNPWYFVFGIPFGILLFVVGDKMARRTKKFWIKELCYTVPLGLWFLIVVLVDIVF